MSDKPNDDPKKATERIVEHNGKFNVPLQAEKEEAEVLENAKPENIADDREIHRKKERREVLFTMLFAPLPIMSHLL